MSLKKTREKIYINEYNNFFLNVQDLIEDDKMQFIVLYTTFFIVYCYDYEFDD